MLAFSFISLASLALAAPLARRQSTDAASFREPIAARWQMRECPSFIARFRLGFFRRH